jgi:membrane-associated phospholipid phosphatase
LIALFLGSILVALCYWFVDQPVAFFVRDEGINRYSFLKWLTYPPKYFQDWSPAVLVGLMVRRAFGPFHRYELALLAATISVVLADQFKQSLAFVFGRTWPDTWIDNNPSLLRDGVSHFNFFHGGRGYESFPSGHTARTLAAAAVVWIAYPWWRWAALAASLAVAVGLIGMDYHFVGDVVAGGFIGALVGIYTAYLCGLSPDPVCAHPLTKPSKPSVEKRNSL